MHREHGDALKARWALRFSSMTDGGLDDDFAEEVYSLVRGRPELLGRLEQQLRGSGWNTAKRRMLIDTIRRVCLLAAQRYSEGALEAARRTHC